MKKIIQSLSLGCHFVACAALLFGLGTAAATTPKDGGSSSKPPLSSMRELADTNSYVDHEAAGYDVLFGNDTVQSKHFQLLARKKPSDRIRRIATVKEWQAFIKGFAGIETNTRKPLNYRPDFKKEQIIVLYTGAIFRGNDYMDIEVYREGTNLKAFAFHGLSFKRKDPAAISKAVGKPFHGTFYLATVPKRFERHSIEFRMARQSWGRPCSKFSPPIKRAKTVLQEND